MKFAVRAIPVLALTIVAGCGGKATDAQDKKVPVAYGAKVKITEGEKVKFPDFSLKFVGTRKETGKDSKPVSYYDFKMKKGESKKILTWSSAENGSAPMPIKFDDGQYSLERVKSKKLGSLAEDEVVIWKTGDK